MNLFYFRICDWSFIRFFVVEMDFIVSYLWAFLGLQFCFKFESIRLIFFFWNTAIIIFQLKSKVTWCLSNTFWKSERLINPADGQILHQLCHLRAKYLYNDCVLFSILNIYVFNPINSTSKKAAYQFIRAFPQFIVTPVTPLFPKKISPYIKFWQPVIYARNKISHELCPFKRDTC